MTEGTTLPSPAPEGGGEGARRAGEFRAAGAVHHDPINSPLHYGGADDPFETIKVLEAWMPPAEFVGFLKGNALKYLSRHRQKGGLEDLKKARWYVDRMIAFIERAGPALALDQVERRSPFTKDTFHAPV